MAKTVRVCPRCGEHNGRFDTWCRVKTCGSHFGEIPETEVDEGASSKTAEVPRQTPDDMTRDIGVGPKTELAPPCKGLFALVESPQQVIRVCGAGILGRGAENDLVEVPRSNLISRRHAQVIAEAGSIWVMDLGSTAGTMVNGRRCGPNERVPLQEGSVVTFAETSFVFRRQS